MWLDHTLRRGEIDESVRALASPRSLEVYIVRTKNKTLVRSTLLNLSAAAGVREAVRDIWRVNRGRRATSTRY